jgi:catecholate siderophore receptor
VNHTRSDIEVASIFVQDQVSLSSTIKLMIGGRLDHFDIAVTDRLTNQTESRADKVFSPRGGLIYKPAEQLSLYLSYSETFLPRSGEQFKKLSASAARLDPDVFESQELGLKWDFYHDISMA